MKTDSQKFFCFLFQFECTRIILHKELFCGLNKVVNCCDFCLCRHLHVMLSEVDRS